MLYQWHLDDPIINSEISRTWAIAEWQDDIPNPFILDDSLVYRAYFYEEDENNDETIGDVTQDGSVNIVDVVLIVNYLMNTQILDDVQLEIADVNTDGDINIIDIVTLVGIIIGD